MMMVKTYKREGVVFGFVVQANGGITIWLTLFNREVVLHWGEEVKYA